MLTFPYSILKPRSWKLDIVGGVVSGGVTFSGQQQRVNAAGGGLWALQMDFPRFSTPDQIRSWRAIQYGSQGGVVPVNIALCDMRQAPRPSNWAASGGVPHSDGSPFSDSSLYASASIVGALAADAALRATTVRVVFDGDSVPLGGEFFSLAYGEGRNEIHAVLTATLVSGSTYDLTIAPPLRAAHEAGETVNWDHPTGTFVLAQPESMSAALDHGRWMSATAAFVEYLG
jgi:hypothetical protein